MSGNSFGKLFTLTTAGESHGDALVGIVDGCPPGMKLTEEDLQGDLDLRKPGSSRHTTQRRETDEVKIVSGTFEGVTTGTPIGLLIENNDQRPRDYSNLAQLGPISYDKFDWNEVHNNPFFCPDSSKVPELEEYMDNLRKSGDSIGARINIVASNMITGLGEPIFDRLDADIAHAMMSINAVKGIEIGAGFDVVNQKGSDHRDIITPEGFKSNNSGGILGGISSGQDLLISIALKPTSSIRLPVESIDKKGHSTEISTTGRHDPCVGIRATPIAEAMLAITLMDHALRNRAQNADVDSVTPPIPASKK